MGKKSRDKAKAARRARSRAETKAQHGDAVAEDLYQRGMREYHAGRHAAALPLERSEACSTYTGLRLPVAPMP